MKPNKTLQTASLLSELAAELRRQASHQANPPKELDDSLLPFAESIAPRVAAELAVTAVEEVDREIGTFTDDMIRDIEALGDKMRLRRQIHRQMHIDQIQTIVGHPEKSA